MRSKRPSYTREYHTLPGKDGKGMDSIAVCAVDLMSLSNIWALCLAMIAKDNSEQWNFRLESQIDSGVPNNVASSGLTKEN